MMWHKCLRLPLMVAGIFFALFALMHLLRLSFGWPIVIGTTVLPMWGSGISLLIAAALALWMFKSSCCCKCAKCDKCEKCDIYEIKKE